MDQNQKLIEASKMLKEYCLTQGCYCRDCIFYTDRCVLSTLDMPEDWEIPKLQRWSDEDIALAKALKAFGAVKIEKREHLAFWVSGNDQSFLPDTAFKNLRRHEEILIDDIIEEENNEN